MVLSVCWTIWVATLEGPRGALGASNKMSESVFLRSLEAKYTYFQGFEHADFVNLEWPLEALGPSWDDFGHPLERLSGLWEAPGGLEKKGSGPGGLQGGSRT